MKRFEDCGDFLKHFVARDGTLLGFVGLFFLDACIRDRDATLGGLELRIGGAVGKEFFNLGREFVIGFARADVDGFDFVFFEALRDGGAVQVEQLTEFRSRMNRVAVRTGRWLGLGVLVGGLGFLGWGLCVRGLDRGFRFPAPDSCLPAPA